MTTPRASSDALPEMSLGTAFVSVVVCTCNRADHLAKTLASLSAQSLPDKVEWEVLVLDNNSKDRTREVTEEFCRRFPERFRYIFEGTPGKSYAMNRGIQEARGDVIAFTDDDVTLEADWLWNLTTDLHHGQWAGAGGRTLPERGFVPPRWLPLERKYALAPLAIFDKGNSVRELTEAPYGNNMAYRKAVIQKYGGIRTDLGPCSGSRRPQKSEDSEFGNRLLLAGEKFVYRPDAVVYHCVPPERVQKRYFLQWWFDKARSDVDAFGARTPGWSMLGVPMRFFPRLVVWTMRWMLAVDPARRFDCKLTVWTVTGQILESFRMRGERTKERFA